MEIEFRYVAFLDCVTTIDIDDHRAGLEGERLENIVRLPRTFFEELAVKGKKLRKSTFWKRTTNSIIWVDSGSNVPVRRNF
jgi:hypothetical protein